MMGDGIFHAAKCLIWTRDKIKKIKNGEINIIDETGNNKIGELLITIIILARFRNSSKLA